MTPTHITLEVVRNTIQLRVSATNTAKGYSVIESSPYKSGASLPKLRKHAVAYAKRFNIKFTDCTITEVRA